MPMSQLTTKDALLHATGELLERVGYASFSYRDLAEVVGIRTASIHYYFPTKEDLGVAWAAWYQETMLTGEIELSVEYPDVRQRLMALARSIATCAGSTEKSCPISLLQAEYAVLPPRLQRRSGHLSIRGFQFSFDGSRLGAGRGYFLSKEVRRYRPNWSGPSWNMVRNSQEVIRQERFLRWSNNSSITCHREYFTQNSQGTSYASRHFPACNSSDMRLWISTCGTIRHETICRWCGKSTAT